MHGTVRATFIFLLMSSAGCSLLLSSSDHQGGNLDAGLPDASPLDATHAVDLMMAVDAPPLDLAVDAGPECTTALDCSASGFIACVSGHCTYCASPTHGEGVPLNVMAHAPLATFVGVAEGGVSPLYITTPTYNRLNPAVITVSALDPDFEEATITRPLGLILAEAPTVEDIYGFAIWQDPSSIDRSLNWFALVHHDLISGETQRRQSRVIGTGHLDSSDDVWAEAATSSRYVGDPTIALTPTASTPRFVARRMSGLSARFISTNASGGEELWLASAQIPDASSVVQSSDGAFVLAEASVSLSVVLWNPNDASHLAMLDTPGRSGRAVIATGDRSTYYIAYAAGSDVVVLRGECDTDPSTCAFANFASISGTNVASMVALRVVAGFVAVANLERGAVEEKVVLRVFDEGGTPYPVMSTVLENATTVRVASSTHATQAFEDVALAVSDTAAELPTITVTTLRGDPAHTADVVARTVSVTTFTTCASTL